MEYKGTRFRAGGVVAMPDGEYFVESYDGLNDNGWETYTIVSHNVKVISGRPVNRFKAAVIPTLTITGCK